MNDQLEQIEPFRWKVESDASNTLLKSMTLINLIGFSGAPIGLGKHGCRNRLTS